jgi:D-aminoacyl-tRNA deacylase
MHIALVHSTLDPAGVNIHARIRAIREVNDDPSFTHAGHTWEFVPVEGRLIYQQGLDERADADLIIFLSRHTSRDPIPVLTTHVTGNLSSADYGGEPGTLAKASPAWMHAVLNNLSAHAPPGYRVSYEVTHHGPTDVTTPSLFVEIGSTEEEWNDAAAGMAVAHSVLEADPKDVIPLIGFGGTHYAARQTSIALSSRGAFGHIAHTREIETLDEAMIRLMMEQSGAVAAYIDKKALPKPQLRQLEGMLAAEGVPLLGEGDIRGAGDLPWEMYRRLWTFAHAVAPNARTHFHRIEGRGTPASFTIPKDLLQEVLRIDPHGFLGRLDDLPVIHLTSGKGTLLPIFISYDENRSQLIHDLITTCVQIIISSEDTETRHDCLFIRKMRFDPRKARDLGIPKGPLFGILASGREVEVGGKRITPAMVSVCSIQEIHVPGLERYL